MWKLQKFQYVESPHNSNIFFLRVHECSKVSQQTVFIDPEAREIMYLVGSVRPSVFVCVSNNRADAVDQLLIT